MTFRTALTAVLALGIVVSSVSSADAQLADPGGNDQIVGVFLQKAKGDEWRGGIVSRGDQELRSSDVKFTWQLDYGSRGANRVTAAGVIPSREAEVSKNTGVYTLSYVRRFGAEWRITGDAGVEHKRLVTPNDSRDEDTSLLLNASLRNIGARLLGHADGAPEFAWSLQANMTTTRAVMNNGDGRKLFVDPVVVLWLSFWSGRIPREPQQQPRLFNRVQFRAEGAGMRAFDASIDGQAHWDGALVFFITPENGLMLRRFSGFFDHNLRHRKAATTVNLIWKFR